MVLAWGCALASAASVARAQVPAVQGYSCEAQGYRDAQGNMHWSPGCGGSSGDGSGGAGSGRPVMTQRKEIGLRFGPSWRAPGEDGALDIDQNTVGLDGLFAIGGRPSFGAYVGAGMDFSTVKVGDASKYVFGFPFTVGLALTPRLGRSLRGVLAAGGGMMFVSCSDGLACGGGFLGELRVGLEPHPGRNRAVGIGLAAVLTAIGGMDDKMQPPLLMFRMSIVFGNPKLPW